MRAVLFFVSKLAIKVYLTGGIMVWVLLYIKKKLYDSYAW